MIGKLFNRWFLKKCQWAWEHRSLESPQPQMMGLNALSSAMQSQLAGHPMRFNIYRANGGMIIQVIQDSDRVEREQVNLYILNDSDNIGEELNKIIIMESLKKP